MSACKEVHLPCVAKEVQTSDTVGGILNQSDFLTHDQAQMLGQELNLAAEMSEGEYTHLQHLIQAHMETNESGIPDENSVKDTPTISPLSTTQAIDLSTSSDGHDTVLPGEKTPTCFGEVPGFVLAKIRSKDSLAAPLDNTNIPTQTRGPCHARVCLEKRFDSIAGNSIEQNDLESAVLGKSLTIVQQGVTQGVSNNTNLSKWIRTDRTNEMPGSYIGFYKPVTNICGTVIGQVSHLEPKPQQSFFIPLNLCSEKVLTDFTYPSVNNIPENEKISPVATKKDKENISKASIETPDSAGDSGSSVKKRSLKTVSSSLRREKHNNKERERRKMIRLYCDELNMLVPFCQTDTDKVTTLQWTSAYLRYINKLYGDKIKEEFRKTFTDKNGRKPNPSAVNDLILQDTESIPMSVEP